MNSVRERQILAYRRAQAFVGAQVEGAPSPVDDVGTDDVGTTENVLYRMDPSSPPPEVGRREDRVATPGDDAPLVEFSPVDPHWLQVKLRQLNVPALRLLLAHLPAPLQRILLPLLEKPVAAELLKRARPTQRRELLRGVNEVDTKLFDELGFYYQQLFASEQRRAGKERLEEICRYLSPQQRSRLGPSGEGAEDGWQGSPSLQRMVRRLNDKERALLLGHPGLGRAVLGLLSPGERLSCLAELIRLADLPAHRRRRRLRALLVRGMSASTVSGESVIRRVGV